MTQGSTHAPPHTDAHVELHTGVHGSDAAVSVRRPTMDDMRLASARRLARPAHDRGPLRWVAGLLGAAVGAMLLPWQQSVQGRGELTALSPSDRPQDVPAVIGGRIAAWHVQEGAFVRRGQLLVRLSEVKVEYLDPTTIDRYREQLVAKRGAVGAKREKAAALAAQIAALEQGLGLSLEKARNKVVLYRAALDAASADSGIAFDQLDRRERLANEGLSSTNDLQAARLRAQQASARLVEKRAELANAEIELRSLGAEYADKLAKARAERSATVADVADGEADASKLQNATDNLALRNRLYDITAPQDGYVVRAIRAGVGEQVKEGDAVVTVMPARPRLAAAVQVGAVDAPLLSPGRRVRLQFDGWPALQFSGWPRAAVGTFGGVVAVVDRVAAPDGTFRVLVSPDPAEEPWPAGLRQGSGVIAWAMLDEVRLGYELWRRVNGFPQSLAAPPGVDAKADAGAGAGAGK
ncbi:MAG: HlyD family secretion protein [Gemmatirosa sp.]